MFRALQDERGRGGGSYNRGHGVRRRPQRYPAGKTAKVSPMMPTMRGGLGKTLGSMRGRRGGRHAVYQEPQPIPQSQYHGKAPGAAGALFGLKAISNVLMAIENYKAAQDMLQVAQEKRDKEAADAARALMEQSAQPLLELADKIPQMEEAEGAAMAKALTEAAVTVGLDEEFKTRLDLRIGAGFALPSEAEAAGALKRAEAEGTGAGQVTAWDKGGKRVTEEETEITEGPATERNAAAIASREGISAREIKSAEDIASGRVASAEKINQERIASAERIAAMEGMEPEDIRTNLIKQYLEDDPENQLTEREFQFIAPKLEIDELSANQLSTIASRIEQ